MKNPYEVGSFDYFNWYFTYDSETGDFFWKNRNPASTVKIGSKAGFVSDQGYPKLYADGKNYLAHRVAWLLSTGSWPKEFIDHIDGNPGNNKITNLREATRSQNNQNRKIRKDSSTGIKGVYWYKKYNKYVVEIMANGKKHFIGYYADLGEAKAAYERASKDHHGDFARRQIGC